MSSANKKMSGPGGTPPPLPPRPGEARKTKAPVRSSPPPRTPTAPRTPAPARDAPPRTPTTPKKQETDFAWRRRCGKCHDFVGPAATYCQTCGHDLEGHSWRGVFYWGALIVLAILGYGFYQEAGGDFQRTLELIVDKAESWVLDIQNQIDGRVPASDSGAAPRASVPPEKIPARSGPSAPEGTLVKVRTKSGFWASYKKEWLHEATRLAATGQTEALKKMIEARQVSKLKGDLSVYVEEMGPDWVKLRLEGRDTTFYTVPAAVVF